MSRGASSRDEEKRERKRKKKDISNDKVYRGLNRRNLRYYNKSFHDRMEKRILESSAYICVCVSIARNQREETRNWISNEYFGGGKQESKVTFSRATFL